MLGEFSQKKRARTMQDISNTSSRIMQDMQDTSNTNFQDLGSTSGGQNFNNQKKARLCQKCKQPGHYAPHCQNV